MPVFEYTALGRSGREERGAVDADSAVEARRELRRMRVHVLTLESAAEESPSAPTPLARWRITFRSVRGRDVAAATRQLAMLLHSGMALVPALGALVEQLAGHPLGAVLSRVRDRVNEGTSLTRALEEHPKVFSEIFINMVSAGEASGDLENVLTRLADMSERRVHVLNKVRAALAYPAFMSVVGLGVIIFLLSYVVPSIAKLFNDLHRTLPWPTLALITISRFLTGYLWLVLGGAVALFALLRIALATAAGRLAWDRMMLKLPLFGQLFLKMAISRFARTLGTLLASGVSILDALEIVKRVLGNSALVETLDDVKESVRHGDSITNPLRRSGTFPPIVCHMVAAGERGGNVEEGLLKVADIYDNEVENTVNALTSLLEPVMILILGAIVGFIVLSILLPIFDINQAIR